MEESAEEAARREELLKMYHATKDALEIIADVTSRTTATPVPPPVKNDWLNLDTPNNLSRPSSSLSMNNFQSRSTAAINNSQSRNNPSVAAFNRWVELKIISSYILRLIPCGVLLLDDAVNMSYISQPITIMMSHYLSFPTN